MQPVDHHLDSLGLDSTIQFVDDFLFCNFQLKLAFKFSLSKNSYSEVSDGKSGDVKAFCHKLMCLSGIDVKLGSLHSFT